MIRNLSALCALVLSLTTVACVAPVDSGEESTSDELETSRDVVSRNAYFETFEGLDGQYYFHLVAANGQNVLRSEGYTRRASAEAGIASVIANGQIAARFEIKQGAGGDYYFTLEAKNGEILGVSQQYASKSNAARGARTVQTLVTRVVEEAQEAPREERFELFKGEDTKTYFRLRAANGEIILGSQGHTSVQSARSGIASVRENGSLTSSYQITEGADGSWFVHLVAGNGEVIARGESYSTKSNATRAVIRLAEILSGDVPEK